MPKNANICRVLFAALPDHYFKCNYCNKKTLRKYLAATTRAVEKEIANTIPPMFGAIVCKNNQEVSMKSVLKLFDKMVEMFPVTGDYLRPDADIVHHPVSRGAETDLTPEESQGLQPLQLEAVASDPAMVSELGVRVRFESDGRPQRRGLRNRAATIAPEPPARGSAIRPDRRRDSPQPAISARGCSRSAS
ncbi:uncharacterized protein PITG_08963 [Phytophthora infestans T30-4]|uniref:Uncharacterized protein n=1 Tax=Phytophthora infestans (strain T30-4) TaxID=403677 RepID=D0NDL4_PHYIT|nr:uncharacterized protein PITG_08963 [Phytophthora infestans T30-4]EEY56171.1 hypothetical protein PITG_08963 [Phytophthora infestans T30-4]|eukprot:XP_002903001.1 hypothetical protein PITG_08963 [Phytophthora infestans T30-4]